MNRIFMDFADNLKTAAPVVLRLAMAFIFVWFGFSQFLNPASWTGFVPAWVVGLTGINATGIVYMNGIFEMIAGTLLALGVWVRWAALLLSAHLFVITIGLGMSAIGIRDLGLSISTFCIFLFGDDSWSSQSVDKVEKKF